MSSQEGKNSPPREGGKSETVRAAHGAEGHQGRAQVYEPNDESFTADVLQREKTQSNEQARKQSIDSDTSNRDTTSGATPAVDGRNSQEFRGTGHRQGTVPLGEGADQSCSSSAPTVHMTGPIPPWSVPVYPGMNTMGWNGGFTPGPMQGTPFSPWGMPASSNVYADPGAMSPHLQQIAYIQHQLNMMQQAMSMPLGTRMQYEQPRTIPRMGGHPVQTAPRPPRHPNPDRFEELPHGQVPFGEEASSPRSPNRNEGPRSFQSNDDDGSESSQGSEQENDSDSEQSQAESQATGGSKKRGSTDATTFKEGALVGAVTLLTSTIAKAVEKQLLPQAPPPPAEAAMDTDSTGKFQAFRIVLSKRVYDMYIHDASGKFRVPQVSLAARMTTRLASKVVQELQKQSAVDPKLKRQLYEHMGRGAALTESTLNLIPDTYITRAFEGMSSMSDMSKFPEEVTRLVKYLAETKVPGIQISASQSLAAPGTADRLADVAANYQQWHQILWSLFDMMTQRTPEEHVPPLLSRRSDFHAYSFQSQLMDYFGAKQCDQRKQAEAVIRVGLKAFENECRAASISPTEHEYQEKIRSLAMDMLTEDAATVEKAERKLRDANRTKFTDPTERAKDLQSLTPSPPRKTLGWGGGGQLPTRGDTRPAPQSLNAAFAAYSPDDSEDERGEPQYLAPMQQPDGQRGQWESRGNRDYNGGGRGYSGGRGSDGGRGSNSNYTMYSGYSTAGRTTVQAKSDEGCFLEMRVAVSKGTKPSGTCTNRACPYKHGEGTWSHRCANDAVSILGSEHCGFGHNEQDSKAKMLKAIAYINERPDISLERVVNNCLATIAAVEEFQATRRGAATSAGPQVPQSHSGAAGGDARPAGSSSRPALRSGYSKTQHASVAFSEGLTDEQHEAEIEADIHHAGGSAHHG
jgi:uncharacterized membrane protein YgcG